MKLLEDRKSNGECLDLALRNEHYKIENIAAPLPTAMTPEDFARNELIVISHPGWARACLNAKGKAHTESYANNPRLIQLLKERRGIENLDPDTLQKLKDDLVKYNFFNRLFPGYFHEELKSEVALDFARARKIPVIMTVPCESYEKSNYVVSNHSSVNFVSYINRQILSHSSTYVIPTMSNNGCLIGQEEHIWEDLVSSIDSEDCISLFGNVLKHKWDNIFFAGGAIHGCLLSTLGYFVKNNNVNLINSLCYSSEGRTRKYPRSILDVCFDSIGIVSDDRNGSSARFKLLKALRPFDDQEARDKEYRFVRGIFNEYGTEQSKKKLDIIDLKY